MRVTIRCLPVLLAALLAACVHRPQAAFQDPGPDRVSGPQRCRENPEARAALQRVAAELQARGMALQAKCNADSGDWMVRVLVLDGMQASALVRGPLADGQEVDMGTPYGVAQPGAATAASGFSPDVLYNRQWLRALMARQQFGNLPDAWWHFVWRGH